MRIYRITTNPGGGQSHERTIRVCPAVNTPFFRLSGSSSDPQLHFARVLKTPVFSIFFYFYQKNWNFSNFADPKAHFSSEFQLLTSKISLKMQLFIPYFYLKNQFFKPSVRCFAPRTPPPKSKSSAPGYKTRLNRPRDFATFRK